MRKLVIAAIAVVGSLLGGMAQLAPAGATAVPATAPYCGITWGSLPKSDPLMTQSPLTNVRAGRHTCYDRLVFDLNGPVGGYNVEYVTQVTQEGSGDPVPLRGGAFIQIGLHAPAYDQNGQSTYNPPNPSELANVTGWQTFRQVAFAGTFEGYTTIGLGVRARLPFRVFVLAGPGSGSRIVVDVANFWS